MSNLKKEYPRSLEQFSHVPQAVVDEDCLSVQAYALLVKMWAYPEDFVFSFNDIRIMFSGCGMTCIQKAFAELEENGFVKRELCGAGKSKTPWKYTLTNPVEGGQ
jgi:hypothetical protein